jgi:hypothetical protein
MTGLPAGQVLELVEAVQRRLGGWQPVTGRRRRLGLFDAVVLVLFLMRQNVSQQVAGELFGCSQPTVSRCLFALRDVLAQLLGEAAAPVQAYFRRSAALVDGTLARTGDHRSRASNQGMYSGKRHAAGFNLQVATDPAGRLLTVGKPVPGAAHDAKAWHDSGLAATLAGHLADGGPGIIADLGYLGTGAITPVRTPPGRRLHRDDRRYNTSLSRMRAPTERGIAHLKNWKILATGYRGLLANFPETCRLVVHLELYRTWRLRL